MISSDTSSTFVIRLHFVSSCVVPSKHYLFFVTILVDSIFNLMSRNYRTLTLKAVNLFSVPFCVRTTMKYLLGMILFVSAMLDMSVDRRCYSWTFT